MGYLDETQVGYNPVDNVDTFIQREGQETPSFTDVVSTAYENEFAWNAVDRISERSAYNFEQEEGFSFDDETKKSLLSEYDENDYNYVLKSKSKEEYLARRSYIEADKERERTLALSGTGGFAASLFMGMVDPVQLGIGVLSGGMSYGSKAGKVMQVLKAGVSAGVESAVAESILMKGNTQSDIQDLYLAFGTGGVLGSGFKSANIAYRGFKGLDEVKPPYDLGGALDTDAHSVDVSIREDVDANLLSDFNDNLESAGIKDEYTRFFGEDVDSMRIDRDFRDVEKGFKAEMQSKLRGADVDRYLDELASIETERADIASRGEGFEDIDALARDNQGKLLNLEEERVKLADKSTILDRRARELEQKLDMHTRALKAEEFKKKWKSWSPKKKASKLYKDGYPSKRKVVAEQKRQVLVDNLTEEQAQILKDPTFIKQRETILTEAEGMKAETKKALEERFGCEVL